MVSDEIEPTWEELFDAAASDLPWVTSEHVPWTDEQRERARVALVELIEQHKQISQRYGIVIAGQLGIRPILPNGKNPACIISLNVETGEASSEGEGYTTYTEIVGDKLVAAKAERAARRERERTEMALQAWQAGR